MSNARTLTCAAAVLTLLGAQTAEAATAISGSVSADPVPIVNSVTAADVFKSDAWTGAPIDLSVTAGTLFSSAADVAARSRVDAQWDSTEAGLVTVIRGWSVDDPRALSTQVGASLATTLAAPDWNYTFVAEGDGTFFIAFDLLGFGDAFGLGFWDLAVSVDGGPAVVSDLLRATAAPDGFHAVGGREQALQAGRTYSISLLNNEGFSESPVVQRTRNGREEGTFTWSITQAAVPEPSTWALMLIGFGGLGVALRRSRRQGSLLAA